SGTLAAPEGTVFDSRFSLSELATMLRDISSRMERKLRARNSTNMATSVVWVDILHQTSKNATQIQSRLFFVVIFLVDAGRRTDQ
ncbi:hypothetical protein, partial [Paraburkholderia humisilvae]|uniref:hypothetical protein n=1 Tax=Paraburkholderia humisilvae TaxID=627669 RepID=UPI0035EA5341